MGKGIGGWGFPQTFQQLKNHNTKWILAPESGSVVSHASTSSAPGPNRVPYWLYKSAPDVLRVLWKLMKVEW